MKKRKGGDCGMIQIPTDVRPDGHTFDATIGSEHGISFTFNGDMLTYVMVIIDDYNESHYGLYHYDGGRLIVAYSWFETLDATPFCYSGETFNWSMWGWGLQNGHDYTVQYLLAQSNADGSKNVCDMPVLSGVFAQTATQGATTVYIENGIKNIYEWSFSSPRTPMNAHYSDTTNNRVRTEMVIKIESETHTILSYDVSTGQVILDRGFSKQVNAGFPYTIYSNYMLTPAYFFKCRTTPTLSTSIDLQPLYVNASAEYTQAENVMIKYFYFTLSLSIDGGETYEQLAQSPKVYSQRTEYQFARPYGSEEYDTGIYKLECVTVTNDGIEVKAETTKEISTDSKEIDYTVFEAVPDNSLNAVMVTGVIIIPEDDESYLPNDIFLQVFRRNTVTNEIVRLDDYDFADYFVGNETNTVHVDRYRYRDFTVSNNESYEYICVPINKATGEIFKGRKTVDITTDFVGYTITALNKKNEIDKNEDKNIYTLGDTWKFVGDISDTTITQNRNTFLHVGYAPLTDMSYTDVNYMTGSLSAMIGYINCETQQYTDNIELVRQWRKFITQKCPFILRSQKGDVWIVNITDNPTTEYQENHYKVPTRISFSWAECNKPDNIIIVRS